MLETNQFMAIRTEDGQLEEILGKYMYYSLPKLMVRVDKVKEICTQTGFPVAVNDHISITDAFRSATGALHDRITELYGGENLVRKIYCRDNQRVQNDVLSRELVQETLFRNTNEYRKLANITLDKTTGEIILSDVSDSGSVDVYGYFAQAERLFELYQQCIGNRSIETMAEHYIRSMHAIGISARGHHYFIPKAYMHQIALFEDFMELLGAENLFTYADNRDAKYISINSMYVADDAKQRGKMAREFCQSMNREIEECQKYMTRLIQSASASPKVLDRWMLKLQTMETRKNEYERILKQNLSGIDENFTALRDLCEQFEFRVKRSRVFGLAA